MNPGDNINIKASVLRVEGDRVDAQTANGQLIQTDKTNVAEYKAVLNAPANKQISRKETK